MSWPTLLRLLAGIGASLVALPTLAVAAVSPSPQESSVPCWIWHGRAEDNVAVYLRKSFVVERAFRSAVITGSGDNHLVVYLNGQALLSHDAWEEPVSRDATKALVVGTNVLAIEGANDGGPAGLALQLELDGQVVLVTDASWTGAAQAPTGWREPAFSGDGWKPVEVLGRVGAPELPWSSVVRASAYGPGKVASPTAGAPQAAIAAPHLKLPAGFRGELLYTVPKGEQGSWVSLCTADDGSLYASDQGGRGIYRIQPAPIGAASATTLVEKVEVPLSGAQGLCWWKGALYANVQGGRSSGVWRISDTNGDGALDRADSLVPFSGGGEHGPHAVIPTADGNGLYFCAGNHTPLPKYQSSRARDNWSEDLLLPRQWDANGHARGLLAPGGWIARCDLDGKNVEIVSYGYRNQYDLALNRSGDLFTYDADMEWDMGTPWYRPTRVCLASSGSEFGWRSGTGKWPEYYEDSCPPVLNIGPGSPTGVVFGYGAKFPAAYQDALYILDWTFGTIYALHLDADGASYAARKEEFCSAVPLAVTDAAIGKDGAFYFAVGGRGTQSALYRVSYIGAESTAPSTRAAAPTELQALRQRLEALHGKVDPAALASAWPHLGHADRAIRFAARVAVENQPVETWRARALAEADPQAALTAMIALARQGTPSDRDAVLARLARLPFAELTEAQRLVLTRALGLAFVRLGAPTTAQREQWLALLHPHYTAGTSALDAELASLLVYLGSPRVVEMTVPKLGELPPRPLPDWAALIQRNASYGGPIASMLADMPPLQDIHYAFVLRNAAEGWTPALRRRYFQFFNAAAKHPGGASYGGFLTNARSEALERLSPAERLSLASITGEALVASRPADVKPPVGPGRKWTLAEADQTVGAKLEGRSFASGRNLFHAANCSQCHRVNGEGGAIGPDLTTLANRFSSRDVLESILEPNKVISEQYGSQIVTATWGESFLGRVVHDEVGVLVFKMDPSSPPARVAEADIESIEDSKLSQMPAGLIDALNADELRDLMAYLLAGGREDAAVFRKGR